MAVKRARPRAGRVRKRVRRPRTRLMRRIVRRPVTSRKRPAVPLSRPFKRFRRASVRRRSAAIRPARIGGDYSKLVVSAGRPRRVGARVTTALAVDYRILRWQRLNRQDGVEPTVTIVGGNSSSDAKPLGAQPLSNTFGVDPSPIAPIHVYDLNATHNFDTAQTVCYQLRFDSTTAAPVWNAYGNPQQPDGTSDGTGWQVEYSTNAVTALKKPYISPRWYDMRFLCYGARKQPTTYEILVVRFMRDWLAPALDGFDAIQPENVDEAYAFWQAMAKKLCFSDIMPAQSRIGAIQRHVKVVKYVRFTLPTADTTDADTAPPSKMVKLFVPDGRLLRYRPNADSYTGVTAPAPKIGTSSYVQSVPVSGNELNVPIYEKDRMFLIVRASNTTPVPFDSARVDNTPSYDICIRKKEAMDAH